MAKKVEAEKDTGPLTAGVGTNAGELEVLRDLIFGNQARDFTRRLSDIDNRLEAVRRELKGEQESVSQSLTISASDQHNALRKEAHSRIDKEVQILTERIEQLAADWKQEIENARRNLETRLERLESDANDRIRLLEEESRQRDDDLRAELLTVTAWLEDKKTSRHDLGRMLEEIGQRLQAKSQPASSESDDEE